MYVGQLWDPIIKTPKNKQVNGNETQLEELGMTADILFMGSSSSSSHITSLLGAALSLRLERQRLGASPTPPPALPPAYTAFTESAAGLTTSSIRSRAAIAAHCAMLPTSAPRIACSIHPVTNGSTSGTTSEGGLSRGQSMENPAAHQAAGLSLTYQ